jgi:hypothetical protein
MMKFPLPRRNALTFACAVFLFTVATRWPLRFADFGEHDQARFLCDAILYHYEGGEIFRKYFLLTSPLALVSFAGLDAAFGHAALLPISNALAVLSAGVVAAAAFVVARGLVSSDAWAAAAAVGATFVPGVFFTSLYGYPSAYSLAFLATSAAAVSHGVTRPTSRSRWAWLAAGGVAFVVAALFKVDFALMGTWLLVIVLLRSPRDRLRRHVAFLVGLAVVTLLVVFATTSLLNADAGVSTKFGGWWVKAFQPYGNGRLDTRSIARAVGRGTWLIVALLCAGLALRRRWREAASLGGALVLAAGPLWSFWASVPPLSTRHCIPGALVAGLFAGVLAARLFPGSRLLPIAWPVLLVASNWWGRPYYDLNYHLSGKLFTQYRTNRAAFAAARQVSDTIAADPRPVQVWVGPPAMPNILGRIDIQEIVRYRLACEATEVHNRDRPGSDGNLHTRRSDGTERILFYAASRPASAFLSRTKYDPSQYHFLSVSRDSDSDLEAHGLPLTRYDLRRAYRAP